MPSHTFKFGAALQAAQTGSAPVLIRVGAGTGHGHGKSASSAVAEQADCLAFLEAALSGDANYAISAARQGLAVEPASYMIYARLVWMAQPKWGGNVPTMQRLIAAAQRHVKENPLLLVLRAESTGGEQFVEGTPCMPASEYDFRAKPRLSDYTPVEV